MPRHAVGIGLQPQGPRHQDAAGKLGFGTASLGQLPCGRLLAAMARAGSRQIDASRGDGPSGAAA